MDKHETEQKTSSTGSQRFQKIDAGDRIIEAFGVKEVSAKRKKKTLK
jgi:hypothetical protein